MPSLLEAIEARGRVQTSPDPIVTSRYLSRLQSQQPEAFERITASDSALQLLIAVFSHSNFLSDEVIQHPEWLEDLAFSVEMHRSLSTEEFRDKLNDFLGNSDNPPEPLQLAVFRRRELLRILLRDVLEYCTLSETTEELSNLADAILDVTYGRIRRELVRKYGAPTCVGTDGESIECGFSVIALGKLGGRELNYSSDIDLMFIYSANGETTGQQSITNKEFFKKVANQLTDLLSTYTVEGMCYRVDLRLRPDGRLGEVCLSFDGAKAYYENRARDWELQMLIKARVAAGEPGPGRELLDFVEPKTYQSTLDFSAVEQVSETRARIGEKLALRMAQRNAKPGGNVDLDVKLARGGIRDIEFLVQCLQRLHGGTHPWVRHGGTLLALARLRDKDLLSDSEYSRLASAYQFLRHLEHRLQFADDRQTHTLPSTHEDLEILARRMPLTHLGRMASADKLLRQLNNHLEEVQETYDRVIHAQQPLYYNSTPAISEQQAPRADRVSVTETQPSNLIRFLDQLAPSLAETISKSQMRRGQRLFEHFLEKVVASPAHLKILNENQAAGRDVIDLFENSPHFAEELIRYPEAIADLAHLRDEGVPDPDCMVNCRSIKDATQLRRYFRREMLRIQAASICLRVPIFTTLQRTSDLADAVVNASYHMAVEQVIDSHPPLRRDYEPNDQLMVIAMGRLGMREFDLGSDADLNFVLPDSESPEMQFWTRVAERTIDLITAYTGEGILFAVDTRLRPNGRQGELVQQVCAYKDYMAHRAEAWEGITYMKSRAVVGNSAAATAFLHEIQEVDWRRYGQSGRSRGDLRTMRTRLETQQGPSNPLKAGSGGYYDIDFALMYLRLKSAGIFFKVLNTPERIDVIEKMGHLEPHDAEFLQNAATFYRAIDHGLRVYSGHAEGKLPNSEAHLEVLTNLVYRWTPESLQDQPLPVKLAEIQHRTREYFKRLFG